MLPLGDGYRITGPGINATGWFQLQGEPGDRVVLTVERASKPAYYAGAVIAGGGVALGLVGLGLVGTANASPGHGTMGAGVGLSIGSVVAIAGGLYLLVSNRRSKSGQETSPHDRAIEAPPSPPRREAVWHEVPGAVQALPRTTESTLLRMTF
jgi:hypothetical protein